MRPRTIPEMIDAVLAHFPDLRWDISIGTATRADSVYWNGSRGTAAWTYPMGTVEHHVIAIRRGLATREPVEFVASLAHELTHARQIEAMGDGEAYEAAYFRYPYGPANPYEAEARAAEATIVRAIFGVEKDPNDESIYDRLELIP